VDSVPPRRTIGAALVGLAALLLGAGGVYWFTAAPAPSASAREPRSGEQVLDDTAVLDPGATKTWALATADGARFVLNVDCVGTGPVEIESPKTDFGRTTLACGVTHGLRVTSQAEWMDIVARNLSSAEEMVVGLRVSWA
jgi:hypothetical protein